MSYDAYNIIFNEIFAINRVLLLLGLNKVKIIQKKTKKTNDYFCIFFVVRNNYR